MKKYFFKKFLIAISFVFIFNTNYVLADEPLPEIPLTPDATPATSTIDTVPPVITLLGSGSVEITVGDTYTDAGANASDDNDGDITSSIIISNNVNTSISGTYTVTYDVKDYSLNSATQVTRVVIVKDYVAPSNLSINVSVDISSTCEVSDIDNVPHSYDSTDSDNYLGICALKAAIDSGAISNVKLSNQYPSMGLFVTAINNKEADPSSQYWALYKNNGYTDFGLSTLPVSVNDTISLKLSDFSGNETGDVVNIKINSLIIKPSVISISTSVDVASSCDISDTDGVSHSYTATSVDSYVAICALKAAIDSGAISNVKLSNQYPSMGLFVTAINNKEADPSSQYWALYKNNGYTDFGLSTLPVSVNDTISLKLSDFSGNETGDVVLVSVKTLISDSVNGGYSGGGGSTPQTEFEIDKAFNFLISKQNTDGSYDGDMYTDWVAISLSLKDSPAKNKIKEYLISNDIDSSIVTDYERRAMALMSLGVNPYSGTGINYVQKIVDSFDGIQFGDPSLINDDIFAIIVLKNAGFNSGDEIITKDINHIISNQRNGSWGSIDMTAAGIEALTGFEGLSGVGESVTLGQRYILNNSQAVLSNPSSASWVMQSEVEVNDTKKYLSNLQSDDGGVIIDGGDINSRIWATSYVIPAILGKTWGFILKDFSKQLDIPQMTAINNVENKKDGNEEFLVTPVEVVKEDYVLSTEKPPEEKIVVKNEITKSNFKRDSISVEDFGNKDIGQVTNEIPIYEEGKIEDSSFLSSISDMFKAIKSFFAKLFVSLGF